MIDELFHLVACPRALIASIDSRLGGVISYFYVGGLTPSFHEEVSAMFILRVASPYECTIQGP